MRSRIFAAYTPGQETDLSKIGLDYLLTVSEAVNWAREEEARAA